MIVSADWVLPIDAPPIRDGAVRIRNGRIADVGRRKDFEGFARAHRTEFPGCAILPGLVNAHTHLSLTSLAGLVPRSEFPAWLRRVVPMMRALDEDDVAASAALGATQCLLGGMTVVGDIAYGPEALASAADLGVGGVFHWEVLGVPAAELPEVLASMEFPHSHAGLREGRARVGLSPHAVYTCGPELLRATAAFAREHRYPLAVHVAESLAETALVRDGTGPLAEVAERLADGFAPAATSPVAYLERLGVLEDALAVHCVHLSPGDARLLARSARGVALCPRSNAYLRNGAPPVEALVASKVSVGIGTDSSASNSALDLFEEARALRALMPSLPAGRLVRMMTLEGAAALGIDAWAGSLSPGKQADLAVVALPATDDPFEALLAAGGPAAVRNVLSAGVWRVREGRAVFGARAIEAAAARAADKAKAARA